MAQAAPPLMTVPTSGKREWSIAVLTLGPLIVYVYGPTLIALISQWWLDPDFGHGLLVPLFSGFLVWNNRARLALLPLKPSWAGLGVVLLSLAMLVVGNLGAELFLARTSLVFLLAGLVILFCGWNSFRALLFPWAFLFLMVPIPKLVLNHVTLPLQSLASQLATSLLSLLGVPVLRAGNIIQLPDMRLEVAEACSGIRSLMSLVTLAIIYGYFTESRLLPRVLLALAAIPIAVVANGLRIVGTGLLANYGHAELARGFLHSFSGWLIFVVSLLILWALHTAVRAVMKR
ncbi:MAG TPA: exosortase A [Terriglobales bacterium]|nr:exosortase A [Terriglobales bacterium]